MNNDITKYEIVGNPNLWYEVDHNYGKVIKYERHTVEKPIPKPILLKDKDIRECDLNGLFDNYPKRKYPIQIM